MISRAYNVLRRPEKIRKESYLPGLNFSLAQVRDVFAGTLKVQTKACLRSLRYGQNDKDLKRIAFDGKCYNTTGFAGCVKIVNLNDFRERLQEAANFGHGVSFCYSTSTGKMFMLNIFPCACPCDKKDWVGGDIKCVRLGRICLQSCWTWVSCGRCFGSDYGRIRWIIGWENSRFKCSLTKRWPSNAAIRLWIGSFDRDCFPRLLVQFRPPFVSPLHLKEGVSHD